MLYSHDNMLGALYSTLFAFLCSLYRSSSGNEFKVMEPGIFVPAKNGF